MTARLLDVDSHGPYASRRIATACQGADECRVGAGRLCSKAGLVRLGQGVLEGTKIRAPPPAYGEARLPDEASRTGAGMRCRMGSGISHTRTSLHLVLGQAPSLNQ